MAEKRQILIELKKGRAIRQISRELRVHRDIIRTLIDMGSAEGWLNPNSPIPSEATIALVLKSNHKPVHELDKYVEEIKLWRTDGYTAIVIQRLLRDKYNCPIAIGAVRRYLRKHCQPLPDPVMVRQTTAGRTMDVDFGFLGCLWDESARKKRKVWVFSARLRHSRKTYRRLVLKQDTITFLACHAYAFEHFGGIPEEVVLDNLKAGVIQSCMDNDMINRSYHEFAEYYDFRISPCLPRTPQHKGGVENDIGYIKKNFWPQVREELKIHPQFSCLQAQEALEQWDREVADVRKIGGISRSPKEIFETEEKHRLKKLKEIRWESTIWAQCAVGRDWRIVYEGSYYSVPYMLIGQTVQCRITDHFVEIFFEHQMMAKHPKAKAKGDYQRNTDHAPPFKEAVLNCTREGLLENAKEIGMDVFELCKSILSEPYIDKLRPVRAILSLALSYEKERLNSACKRALEFKAISYRSVKDILEKGLDLEFEKSIPVSERMNFRFARDPKQYSC